jgi:hypothetical protein
MADLFGRERTVITKHLRNIFRQGELDPKSVRAKFAHAAGDGKTYQVDYFNLDAVLSVGYRVNSKRGTQFRIWATRTLHSHLVRGFSVHERRVRERSVDVEQVLALLARTLTSNALVTDEGRDVLDVVRRYTRTWRLLLEYDENRLAGTPELPTAVSVSISGSRMAPSITRARCIRSSGSSRSRLCRRLHCRRSSAARRYSSCAGQSF